MGLFDTLLTSWINMDFFQVLFPFLLALAIFYGALMWAVGEKLKKGPVALISIILSFFVMLYAKQIPGLSTFITWASGTILALACVVIFIIIILALIGLKFENVWSKDRNWVMIVIVLIIIYIVVVGIAGFIPGIGLNLPWLVNNQDIWTIIIFVVILAIVLWFLGREGKSEKTADTKPSH